MPKLLKFEDLVGAVYDVDDTLLDNNPHRGDDTKNLHERSRLAAIHAVAAELGHSGLLGVTAEESLGAFLNAPVHTMDSALWTLLYQHGIVEDPELAEDNPTLQAIVNRKAILHLELLRDYGVEVNGASAFIKTFEQHGPKGKQAISSGARAEEISVFTNKYGLDSILPRHRIVARGDYTHPKPHPDPFDRGFKTLGLDDSLRSRTLAVEDDPKGYISAYRAGLYACTLTTRFDPDAFNIGGHRPHYIAADMAELGEMIGLPAH